MDEESVEVPCHPRLLQITVTVPEGLIGLLHEYADLLGVSLSQAVGTAVQRYLRNWNLAELVLHDQIERLLAADGRSWRQVSELLDPRCEGGIEYERLICNLDARIARRGGQVRRLQWLHQRLIQELDDQLLAKARRLVEAVVGGEWSAT